MTDPVKISLNQQIEAVDLAATRQASLANGSTVRGLRPKAAEQYDVQRLIAARATLEWLRAHEADIRAFVALPPEARRAAVTTSRTGGS